MGKTLSSLSSFTFGAMSLRGAPEYLRENIQVARRAMDAGVWFHASQEYSGGGAFMVLRHAFDEDRSRTPRLILKIRCDNAAVLKFDVEDALRRLKIDRVDLAQLCRSQHDRRPVVDDFLARGEMWQICEQLKKEGKIGSLVMEVFSSFSEDAIRAVQADMFPGYIFYFSPGERQVNAKLFHLLQEKKLSILSLRTLWGGMFLPERIEELAVKQPENPILSRHAVLQEIFERSGCASWAEFSLSFLRSIPGVVTSIAGTSKQENLQALLEADRVARSMGSALSTEIQALHAKWFSEGV